MSSMRQPKQYPPVNTTKLYKDGQYLKAKVDGGFGRDVLEFLLKGDVVAYRTMATRFGICNGLSSTILIGSATAVFVSIGIYPMWAGDDLYNLVAGNVEKLGNFLKRFSGKYFRVSGDGESKDSKTILQGYKSILTSKITEDSLTNFAKWEPGHGCFRFRRP
ncbi:Aluminum-activated malate transporter 8 [Vitis vinifera]|uniref:Aluminum-activated malate transporter 8 n=1 Tax=Vitis vinifera TaxID=29760 RepID=A0A438FV62_VITVI|nr:Aluminum-activated malate transporter 8 [Vitis vinifera]